VHGCYWHRHSKCPYAYTPKSRVDFWQKKFDENVRRDQLVQETLKQQSIQYIVVWECTIRRMQKDKNIETEELDKIIRQIKTCQSQDISCMECT
jgi:DNA mismatch endonuclease (patch repair protein)